MASQIKYKIAKNFYDVLHSKINTGHFSDFLSRFQLLRKNPNQAIWSISVPDTSINSEVFHNSQKELLENKTVKNVILYNAFDSSTVHVEVDLKHLIKDVLDSNPTKLNYQTTPKKVIIEFSSPNIAKPFHFGHIRSTIIGNFLANIKKKFGNDVVRLNYLGDWGTQLGLVQLGMNLENFTEEDLKKNPIEVLFKAYVKGNEAADKNPELYKQAKNIFCDLENEKEDVVALWTQYRTWTLAELDSVYKRLGITFDEYSWESDYKRAKADKILTALKDEGVLSVDGKNRTVAVIDNKEIPLLKSDNSTLYMLRDLMAIDDRRSRHKFDEMYYVVDNGQSGHFADLIKLSSVLRLDEGIKLEHVKFGRVRGMNTRKGKVTFLSDILDEARNRIYEIQAGSKNTKVKLEDTESTDILGISAVIVNDFNQRRIKDYDFNWEKSLQVKGDTGPAIQYCHCRLCSLETESGCSPATECDPDALMDSSSVNLILAIARYEETLCKSDQNLEPCVLLKYIFDLTKAINVAYKNLTVKNSDPNLSSQRLLMFQKSREVLNEGMTLLGLKPLSKM